MTWDEIDVWLAELGFTVDQFGDDDLAGFDLEADDPWGAIELAVGSLTDDQRRFLVGIGAFSLLDDDGDDDDDGALDSGVEERDTSS